MGSAKKSVECKGWWRRHSCKIFVCIYEFLILAGELSLETLLVVWVSAVSRRRELIALGKTPFGWGKSLRWNHLLYKIKARIDPFVFLVCARTWPYLEPAMSSTGILIWGTWGLHMRGPLSKSPHTPDFCYLLSIQQSYANGRLWLSIWNVNRAGNNRLPENGFWRQNNLDKNVETFLKKREISGAAEPQFAERCTHRKSVPLIGDFQKLLAGRFGEKGSICFSILDYSRGFESLGFAHKKHNFILCVKTLY